MMALSIFLFITSPWFVQVLISPFELNWINQPISSPSELLRNLSLYSSGEFIFFSGDTRLAYGTQEFGLIYFSLIPLILLGLNRYLLGWVGGGILIASLFRATAPFSAALLYLPAIQLAAISGTKKLITTFRQLHPVSQVGIILLFLFNLYEIANFFHVLVVHYPQHIREAVANL